MGKVILSVLPNIMAVSFNANENQTISGSIIGSNNKENNEANKQIE